MTNEPIEAIVAQLHEAIAIADRTIEEAQADRARLVAAFGVPETTSRNYVTKCGKLGLLDANGPATNEPIARAPFDPDKARAAAADTAWPIEGGGRIHGADGYEPHTPRPEPQAPATVQFGVDDAIATLEAAS